MYNSVLDTPDCKSLQLPPEDQVTLPNESYERTSPNPPPRGRHNPFNKPVSQSPQRKDVVSHRIITFKELHNQLGRSVLRDRNEWRFGLNKQNLTKEERLINV